MMLIKPKFWDNKVGILAVILFPLSLLYQLIIFLKKKTVSIKKFSYPIICVGNIYIGGTGKTPIAILLANELTRLKKKSAILRKYYKNHQDEYELIRNKIENLIINQSRVEGLTEAEKSNFDTVILDDGLQDYKIKKDLSIACFNQNQLVGNGLVLPSGPLRESLNALNNVDVVIINGEKNKFFEKKLLNINKDLDIFYSSYKPINLEEFKDKELLAVAGIGNPENFFQLIEKNGLKISEKLIFPDHYKFSLEEIQNIIKKAEKGNYQIIMTEKDYFKIKHFKFEKIKYLKIKLKIENQERLLTKIKQLYA